MGAETRVPIQHEADILLARKAARALGATAGFDDIELTVIGTAISEIARNMLEYGRGGELEIVLVREASRAGLVLTARDRGPGIPDVARAMEDGYSSGKGLGLGLPGTKRLMDDFAIESRVGEGTTVRMAKWRAL